MALQVKFLGGQYYSLAVLENWENSGGERMRLLRAFKSTPEASLGDYVLETVPIDQRRPGLTAPLFITSFDVNELRRRATSQGWKRVAGNPQIVEGLLTHSAVRVLWWRHDLAKAASFIRELKLEFPHQSPLDQDDLVVLSSTGESVTHGHGRWMSYSAASRAELDRAHPLCAYCEGTGVAKLSHFESSSNHVCSCTSGGSYWSSDHGRLTEVAIPEEFFNSFKLPPHPMPKGHNRDEWEEGARGALWDLDSQVQ